MKLTEIEKIELAHKILQTLSNKPIPIKDRIDITEIAMKSLLAKKKVYDRKKAKQ